MSPDAVLKIGGSLSRGAGLESLCCEISRLSLRYRLLIVPGGGSFADQVRHAYQRFSLDETTAHNMALLAMDQFGLLLGNLIPGGVLETDLSLACQSAGSGRAAILMPASIIMRADPLPHSWQVTSDTIAAWAARQSGCQRLVLLKDVDGLFRARNDRECNPGLIRELTVEELSRHGGGVDEYLARFLAVEPLETWVINGFCPGRLAEVLESGYTTGTRIRCS